MREAYDVAKAKIRRVMKMSWPKNENPNIEEKDSFAQIRFRLKRKCDKWSPISEKKMEAMSSICPRKRKFEDLLLDSAKSSPCKGI